MFSRVPQRSMVVWSERKLTTLLCHGRVKAWEKLFNSYLLGFFVFFRRGDECQCTIHSKDNLIVNSFQDAVEHGANGEDGFYISGDGQFSGFIYPA